MTATCIGTPVSWLRLEQLELGLLAASERATVAAHIDDCAACRACRDQLQSAPAVSLRPIAIPVTRPRWRWLALGSTGLAAAAAIALAIILIGRDRGAEELPGARVAVKGGEIAIRLVRESGGSTGLDPGRFLPGDRFKVMLTCPPGQRTASITVHQGGSIYRPLAPATIACGNDVAVPGAFQLDGRDAAQVCAHVSERGADASTPPDVCSDPVQAPSTP